MKKTTQKHLLLKSIMLLLSAILLFSICGCDMAETNNIKLDPENPVTITVWHYYNGAILNAFDAMVKDFNETVGAEKGIIVEGMGMGSVSELEKAVISSANKEVGSLDMPSIFASYADTAYEAEKLELLANLGDYFTDDEQKEYLDSYIEEGKIGLNGELRIFPIAKSTEVFIINQTDWQAFADANNLTYDNLATIEGVVQVAKQYYEWTDAATPDIPEDGKAFYGRDSMANLFIIASKQFGTEIFKVQNGIATIDINEEVMRKIWDNYYVPYINGYFYSYGKYRSDDAKVGDILGYVGSTSSASYFPSEITTDTNVYPIEAKVLPAPCFEGAQNVMVQQGAGMVVTKSTPEEEYAGVVFLKWFTDVQKNTEFAALSGYMPVKKEAVKYDELLVRLGEHNISIDAIAQETLRIALDEISHSELYTNKAFDGGTQARSILDYNLQDKAVADRAAVLALISAGSTREEAVATFNTEENFQNWLQELHQKLNAAANEQ